MNFEDISLSTLSPGTYTIKAIFDGDDTYNPKTTTFILVVGERPEDTHVVIDLDNNQGATVTPTLSFASSVFTIIQDGINFIYPLLTPINPSSKPLEWTSSSENITIDVSNNTMEVRELGTYTITATIIDDTLDTPVSASYTVIVQDEDGNTTKVPKDLGLYFESNIVTYYDMSPEDDKYVLQIPKSNQTDDKIVSPDIVNLFYYTVGDDESNIFLATQGFIPKEYFSDYGNYTITLNFNGNDDWLPAELTYTLSIVERSEANISFTSQNVTYRKENDNIYQLQILNNPHDLPITWSSTGTDVMIDSENSTVKINDNNEFTIIATFNGNELYKPSQATYNIKIVLSQTEARIYFEHDSYSESAASGLVANPQLINPAGLPVTYTISDPNATVEDANNGKWYYCYVSSPESIINATITATFAGDDIYEPMTATCTYSLDNNTSPAGNSGLSFTNPTDRQAGNYYGTYQLQSLNNPNNLPVTWSSNLSSYYCKIDADNGLVYVNEYFPNICIIATFKGNDQYDRATVSYELQITRQDVTLSFDESIVTVNDVEEGKATPYRLQYASSDPFGLSIDYSVYNLANSDWKLPITLKNDGNMYVDLSTATTWMVYASFRGDMVYKPATTSYAITVNTITKENIEFKFDNPTMTIDTATTELDLQSLYWKLDSQDDTFWRQVSYDSSSADYLDVDISCESDLLILTVDKSTGKIYLYDSNNHVSNIPNGTYVITANFYGNSTYNATSASYQVVVSNSQQGGGDEPGTNKIPNGIQWNVQTSTFTQTNSNIYVISLVDVNPYNLPITYTVYGPTGTTLTGNELYCPTTGTVVIEASFSGNDTYTSYLESRVFSITGSQQNPSDYQGEYLTFEALENDVEIYFNNDHSTGLDSTLRQIQYSTDKNIWNNYTSFDTSSDSTANPIVSLDMGQKLYLRGTNNVYGGSTNQGRSSYRNIFASTGRVNISGNIMSLVGGSNFRNLTTLTGQNNFVAIFSDLKVVDASNLILPVTTLKTSCYQNMFRGCSSLTTAPQLPATSLADYCYSGMFEGCTSLSTAPALPATTLSNCCYWVMFEGCTSLSTAPALPATTLSNRCYYAMFSGCTSLSTAPALPATTLADYCYYGMFSGCTSLTSAPQLPATLLAVACYWNMFSGCTSLTSAPVLPATTLASNCYREMFIGCTNLRYIKMLATDISATNCLSGWVGNVASSGTFVKNSSMTSLTTGNSGIPTGWTVQDESGQSGPSDPGTTPSSLLPSDIVYGVSAQTFIYEPIGNTYPIYFVTQNPHNLPITYSVSGGTVNGSNVYIPATGTYTVVASFEGDSTYQPWSDIYFMTITPQ